MKFVLDSLVLIDGNQLVFKIKTGGFMIRQCVHRAKHPKAQTRINTSQPPLNCFLSATFIEITRMIELLHLLRTFKFLQNL